MGKRRHLLAGLGLTLAVTACGNAPIDPATSSSASHLAVSTDRPEAACPGEVPLAHGDYSFAARVPPRRVKNVPPEWPAEAARRGLCGIVIVQAVLDAQGVVRQTRILRSIPMLDDAAVAAVCQWRFTPARVAIRPIAVAVTLAVEFPPVSDRRRSPSGPSAACRAGQ